MRSEEALSNNRFRRQDRYSHFQGFGNSLSYKISEQLRLKASYEWSTRMPRAEEVFGDGMLTLANLELQPERSHNANLELSYQNKAQSKQDWKLSINGFMRAANQLIVLLGDDIFFRYQNVFDATSTGVEASASWTSSNNRFRVNGNTTWQDFRNTSDKGGFRSFKGDRIPNRPYFFSNAAMSYQLPELLKNRDVLSIFWNARYIHGFFRSWESVGLIQFKRTIPAQLVNNAGLTYKLPLGTFQSSLTAEVQNLTNSQVFDFFGVQRPGRAFYIKLTTQF
ncbi:MAG: TonB-dependent receptor [Cyclobacteriaceae bacterium]